MSPDLLPPIEDARRITQSLAMLDAILSPDWGFRYYSFNADWGPGEAMASMRSGSGDNCFLLFGAAGAALKGYAHALEGGSSIPREIQNQVPEDFSSFLREPSWSKVSSPIADDGSHDLLALLVLGGIMWLLVWRSAQMSTVTMVITAVLAGALFGVTLAAYFADGRKKHGLPEWSSLHPRGEG